MTAKERSLKSNRAEAVYWVIRQWLGNRIYLLWGRWSKYVRAARAGPSLWSPERVSGTALVTVAPSSVPLGWKIQGLCDLTCLFLICHATASLIACFYASLIFFSIPGIKFVYAHVCLVRTLNMRSTFFLNFFSVENNIFNYWYNVVQQIYRIYSCCIIEMTSFEQLLSTFSSSWPLPTTVPISVSLSLTILNISSKWNHAVFVLGLFYLT